MTREIKFRAQIVMDIEPLAMKKGHWVEGHYYEDLQDGEWCSWIQECNDITHYKVDKNTLGQFTGLLDKNGKEIYEGDIVLSKLRRARKYDERLVICFDDFEWQGKNANGATTSLSLLFEYHTVEVIGNIHDNPELLKGGTE